MPFPVWILQSGRCTPRHRSSRLDALRLWLCCSPAPADPNPPSPTLALRKLTLGISVTFQLRVCGFGVPFLAVSPSWEDTLGIAPIASYPSLPWLQVLPSFT